MKSKKVPENAFTNYTALSSTSNEIAGGVALLFRYNVAFARIKELQTKDNDNNVAAAKILDLKKLTTTAYIKLGEKEEIFELIKFHNVVYVHCLPISLIRIQAGNSEQ